MARHSLLVLKMMLNTSHLINLLCMF